MFQCVMLLKFLDFMLIQFVLFLIQIKLNTLKTESGQRRISFISINEYCANKVVTTSNTIRKNFIYSRESTKKQEDDPASVGTEG